MKRVVCFLGFVFVLAVGCLSFDVALQEKGAELAAMDAEIARLQRECAAMEGEIAALTSPSALAQRAEEMGMVLAEEGDRAFLPDEDEVTVSETDDSDNDLFARIGAWMFGE